MIKVPVVINSGTITAGVVVSGGSLSITGMGAVPPDGLQLASATLATAVSETLGQIDVTVANGTVNSTVFAFSVSQYDPASDQFNVFQISYVNPTTGTVATDDAATQMVAQLNNLKAAGLLHTTNSVASNKVRVVALTGYPIVIGSSGSNMTVAQTTPGVQATGTQAVILAQYPAAGYPGLSTTAGVSYSYANLIYKTKAVNNAGDASQGLVSVDLWVNASLTGYSTFASDYAAAIAALLITLT